MTKFATPFNGKNSRPVLEQVLPSLTDQDKKDECDINFIIKQYVDRGKPLPCTNATYADLTKGNLAVDYLDALQLVAEQSSNFEMLPSSERDRFKNVENYLRFISNPANLKESYEKGYIDRSSVAEEVIYPERFTTLQQPSQNVSPDVVSPSAGTSQVTSPSVPSQNVQQTSGVNVSA